MNLLFSPKVPRPFQTPAARRTPTPVTIDSTVEQIARGTLETPRIPAHIAAPRTIPTQMRGNKKHVHRQTSRSPVY